MFTPLTATLALHSVRPRVNSPLPVVIRRPRRTRLGGGRDIRLVLRLGPRLARQPLPSIIGPAGRGRDRVRPPAALRHRRRSTSGRRGRLVPLVRALRRLALRGGSRLGEWVWHGSRSRGVVGVVGRVGGGRVDVLRVRRDGRVVDGGGQLLGAVGTRRSLVRLLRVGAVRGRGRAGRGRVEGRRLGRRASLIWARGPGWAAGIADRKVEGGRGTGRDFGSCDVEWRGCGLVRRPLRVRRRARGVEIWKRKKKVLGHGPTQ